MPLRDHFIETGPDSRVGDMALISAPNRGRRVATSSGRLQRVAAGAALGFVSCLWGPAALADSSSDTNADTGYIAPAGSSQDADTDSGQASAGAKTQGAASAAAAVPTELKTMTVNAERKRENVQDVPVSATTISDDKLDALLTGGQDNRELSAQSPSLRANGSNGRAQPRFFIRGYGNTEYKPFASQPVGLVYDGVVQNNAVLQSFPMFDMQSVEVLRGPQGALFGRNTPAGLIDMESVKPSFDTRKGYLDASIGSYFTRNISAAYNVPINSEWALRGALLSQGRDDWIDDTYTDQNNQEGGYKDRAFRLQLAYKPSAHFNALVNVHAHDLQGTATLFRANARAKGEEGKLASGFDVDKISTDGRNQLELTTYGSNVHLNWLNDGWSFHSVTGYEKVTHYLSRGDIDGGNPDNTPFSSETSTGEPSLDQLTQEFRIASDNDGFFNWQAGVYYFYENINGTSTTYDTLDGGDAVSAVASRQTTNSAAGFGQVSLRLTDKLTAKAGARYTWEKKVFHVLDMYNFTLAGSPYDKTTDDNVSWNASLLYALTPNINLYTRVATGYRAPSFSSPDSDVPLTKADAEKDLSYEGGIKSEWLDHRLRANIDAYRYRVKGLQLTADGGQADVTTLLNADKAVGYGVETELQAQVTKNFYLSGSASYNHTQIDDDSLTVAGCGADCTVTDPMASNGEYSIDGNPLPGAPKWIADVEANYRIPLDVSKEIDFYGDMSYQSEATNLLYQSLEFMNRSQVLLGLRAAYQWNYGKYTAYVYCRNCTNEIRTEGGTDFNNLSAYVNDPRIIGVGFKVRF